MADFCQQCSNETFGKDFGDLKGLTLAEDYAKGLSCVVICEGCGPIQVDSDGRCISPDCAEEHGKWLIQRNP